MTPETQALIETLEMFIRTECARRQFDTPAQAQEDGDYNWSTEMKRARSQLDELRNGTLIVTRREPDGTD